MYIYTRRLPTVLRALAEVGDSHTSSAHPRHVTSECYTRVSSRARYSLKTRLQLRLTNPELNPICYLLALLAHHFLHVSRIRVKLLTLRLLM